MFNGKRYITRGIQSVIGIELQILMWGMIEELNKNKEINLDYLQVFNLTKKFKNHEILQEIEHLQEAPSYKKNIIVDVDKALDEKIFVISCIDEEGQEYSTMMLSSEY